MGTIVKNLASFAAGFGTGYLNSLEKKREHERQDKLDQLKFDQAGREQQQFEQQKQLTDLKLGEAQRQADDDLEVRGATGMLDGVDPVADRDLFTGHAKNVVSTYLKQGLVGRAQAFQSYIDSEDGKRYVNSWDKAAKLTAVGNYDAAIPHLQALYNDGSFPDGNRVDIESLGNGSYRAKVIREDDGSVIRTETLDGQKLANIGVNGLAPEKRVEYFMEKQLAETKANAAEKIANLREDRRDERQAAQIEAIGRRQDRQLSAMDARQSRQIEAQGGKITLAQQANNAEIDLARKRLAGMSADDIKGKLQPFLPNGRENPAYDQTIASSWRISNQRKVGDDPYFDALVKTEKPIKQPTPVKQPTPAERFKTDPAMAGMTMGKMTGRGWEVYDGNGKLIGHWQ